MKETFLRKIVKGMAERKAKEDEKPNGQESGSGKESERNDSEGDRKMFTSSADQSRALARSADLKPHKYEAGDRVAHGGMGAILRASDVNIQRTVAMKVLLADKQSSNEHLLRFIQEARLTGQLEHPNIVPVHELGLDDHGKPYYTMKFVQGVTLHEVLEKIKAGDAETIGKFPLVHLLTVFLKVCDAVAFAHSRGVIHRDLKPQNIMIGEYGEVLVMDWGLAKVVNSVNVEHPTSNIEHRTPAQSSVLSPQPCDLTLAGRIMGTPSYMSPEQAEGKVDEVDARSDIYALGAVLYSILTLHPPVSGKTLDERATKIRSGSIAPATTYSKSHIKRRKHAALEGADPVVLTHYSGSEIPASLAAVAMKALALKREDRYQTVQELQRDVAAYQGGFATSAERAGVGKLLLLGIKRHKAEFAVGAVAVVLLIGFVAAIFGRIVASERAAQRALGELKQAVPSFYAEAKGLVQQQNFEEALRKISYACSLVPDMADYHVVRGNILQSLLRMDDATDAYQTALRLDKQNSQTQTNLALCQRILRDNAGTKTLQPSSLTALHSAMIEQRRLAEASALVKHVGGNTDLILAAGKALLEKLGIAPHEAADRIKMTTNGMFSLDLSKTEISDLSPLRGMPLETLYLNDTKATDLTPLKGMPLKILYISRTQVSDLGPLVGIPLKVLECVATRVTDLTPLAGHAADAP